MVEIGPRILVGLIFLGLYHNTSEKFCPIYKVLHDKFHSQRAFLLKIPGGWLSVKYGGKNVLGVSFLIASILTIVTPFTSRWGYVALAFCRFLIGIAHVNNYFNLL